jgi:hypothetical protein
MSIKIHDLDWAVIPDDQYEVRFLHHETSNRAFGGANKVYLHFSVVEPGSYFGTHLIGCYNVRNLLSKPKKNGKFALGKRSKLLLELLRLHPDVSIDAISLKPLTRLTIMVRTRTVTKDYQQRALPLQLHYSVIDEMVSVLFGGG